MTQRHKTFFKSNKTDPKKRLKKSLKLHEITEKSYDRKTRNFQFFRKNWHFWPKRVFFLAETAWKPVIIGKTDQKSVYKRVCGTRRSLKKVMAEKPKIFNLPMISIFRMNFRFFDHNFFLWLLRASNASANAFLGLFYLKSDDYRQFFGEKKAISAKNVNFSEKNQKFLVFWSLLFSVTT